MTTRHTISHADELYAGNAYLDGDSPDGRRGVMMPHIYVREYGAIQAYDIDGIWDSQTASKNEGLVSQATGAWCSGAKTHPLTGTAITNSTSRLNGTIVLDTPRNIGWCSNGNESAIKLRIVGKDEYDQTMCETITGPNNTTVYGVKAFKKINSMYVTADTTSLICIGFCNKIGLPYHLSTKGRFLGLYVDGKSAITSASQIYALVTGLELSTISSSSKGHPDVRGTVNVTEANNVPNGTKLFTAVMVVDHSTRDKAYGVPQVTAIT